MKQFSIFNFQFSIKLILLIFTFYILHFTFYISPAFAQSAVLSLDPNTGTFNKGCPVAIRVNLNTGGAQTDGADAILMYDSSRFTGQTITNGTIYPDFPGNNIDNSTGRITISGLASVSTPFSGSGNLATINFVVSENAPDGATQITFDFDPQNKAETTDSNVVQRGTVADVLNSVVNGSYTIGTGTCGSTITTLSGTGGPSTPSATFVPMKTLPNGGPPEFTSTLAIIGGILTVLGILGLALL